MLSRRSLLSTGLTFLGTSLVAPALARAAAAPLDTLTLAGPPAPPSLYLAHLARQERLAPFAKSVRFEQWKSPDQLRAGVISGEYHVAATPVNVAATLYRKGVPVRLLDVTVWGILSILSTDPEIKSIADLKGRELAVPFRGDMPDIVLQVLLLKAGTDVKLTYVGTPFEGLQLFMARRVASILLPEPVSTAAQMRGKSIGLEVRRAINVQEAWAASFGGSGQIPQAGTLVQAKLAAERPELIAAVKAGEQAAIEWIASNGPSAARLGAELFQLDAEIVQRSLQTTPLKWRSAREARAEIERFYATLAEIDAALIGGGLPDEQFYLG
ncbi:MAG: ABC transporter substrate-binding protein [Bradyrhizobiaceae bacterium]|nr:ABC transporter substrate-binding protein [Bradyrhizobiaceae bacterium]